MDPLASSHTAHSYASRRLLLLIFALQLLRPSITAVAGASSSEIIQDVGSVSEDSLARPRIRGPHIVPNDLLQRSGSVPASRKKILPPAGRMSGFEGSRRLLGDISPPGMWPTPDGQDTTPPQEKFRRRSLLTGGNSPPPTSPWFLVMHTSQDGEDAFLRQGLVADTPYPLVPWALIVNKLRELSTALNMSSLGVRIHLPGYLRLKSTVGAKNRLKQIEQGQQPVVIPDSDVSSINVGNGMRSAKHFKNFDSLQQANIAEDYKLLGRSLRDDSLSAHGMWLNSDNDESELSESEQQSNLAEDPRIPSRSLLQGDVSPPGMWSDSDDDESELSESEQQRNLVELRMPRRSLLQGDISPPGLWPDSDDDESQLSESMLLRRRSLLNKFPRRSLLQGDISPPGMWPDSDDDGESAF